VDEDAEDAEDTDEDEWSRTLSVETPLFMLGL